MAGYGYAYRGGYTTYNGGVAPRGGTDGWNKTSYSSGHTCQPVFIDAEGKRKPITSYTGPDGSTEYYVTKTEIVEVPYMAEYKQRAPVRVEVVRDYGEGKLMTRPLSPGKWRESSSPVRYHTEEKWNKPSSPVQYDVKEKWNKPSSPVRYRVEEKWNKPSSPVQYDVEEKWNKPSSPVRYRVEEKWNKPSSPVRYHVEEKWTNRPSSPVKERPQQVVDFISQVQTQASRPNKFGPLSATYWRQTPATTTTTVGGPWNNQSHGGGWSKGHEANLSQPTNSINTAVEYLKEAVKPPAPRYDGYPNTIDNREAERKYGGLTVGTPPIGSYGRTIDSREAARKYGGTAV
ncbi:sialidase-like isoform X3 [Gossypium australe]|uniref:Sialidase-like isoform X3 n=1 Tax=Gossypium australe TaxID=47621 RepID=A0A5B6X0K5_9ROSI|nr:sialidase-like isoform X3 [Gossypium australe]